ncbi:hypothetical protein Tco_0559332 [Tanacetum coccineum]
MVMEMGVEANLMAEVVAERPRTRIEGARTRNSLTINHLTLLELALLCPRMVLREEDKVERFIWGLPDSIQGIRALQCAGKYKRVAIRQDCRGLDAASESG